MLLLPVSHQDSVVRRLPWVSIGILTVCVALQAFTSSIEADLERDAAMLVQERDALEKRIVFDYLEQTNQHNPLGDVEALLKKVNGSADPRALQRALAEQNKDLVEQLRAGKLTEPGDPRMARHREIEAEIAAVIASHPTHRFGYRPVEGGLFNMLTSMFAHAGWLHLIGNMWFLYLVGCNLEDRWGRWQFLAFYLLTGCIAARMFAELHPDLDSPLVGASGAVAGAMGAFMVCFAQTRVKIFYAYLLLVVPRWGTFAAPTWVVLGLWLAEQLLMTYVETAVGGMGVAYSAHAAGFAFGVVVALLLRATGTDAALDHESGRAAEGGPGWNEHPLYTEALEARDRQNPAAARALLVRLLAEQPDHIGAHEALLDLHLDARVPPDDLDDIDKSLPVVVDHYHRSARHEALVGLYRRLRRALPAYGLTDQELLRFATAAHHRKESLQVVAVVSELMTEHPHSPVIPRAMLLAAEMQGRGGAYDAQRDTLARIAERFPEHACAKLARDELSRLAS